MTHEERARELYARIASDDGSDPVVLIAAALRDVERETLEKVKFIVERIAEHGPEEGKVGMGISCDFCSMGYYPERRDGHHDDFCAVKDAQILLRALAQEKQTPREKGSGE